MARVTSPYRRIPKVEEARRREAEFVRLGLPPTFTAEFASVMNDLDQAVNTLSTVHICAARRRAGVATALRRGLDDVAELDVVVPTVLRDDPVRLAQWRRARHIDGQGTSSPATVKPSLASVAPAAAPAMEPDGRHLARRCGGGRGGGDTRAGRGRRVP